MKTLYLNIKNLFLKMKMVNKYCQKNKEKLQEEARERFQNLSEEEKEKKRQYHRDRTKNLSEEEKQKRLNILETII